MNFTKWYGIQNNTPVYSPHVKFLMCCCSFERDFDPLHFMLLKKWWAPVLPPFDTVPSLSAVAFTRNVYVWKNNDISTDMKKLAAIMYRRTQSTTVIREVIDKNPDTTVVSKQRTLQNLAPYINNVLENTFGGTSRHKS